MPAEHRVVANRSSPAPALWRFFNDAVMGGVATGRITREVVAGRPALRLRGRVLTDADVLNSGLLRRIGNVALGERFVADVCVARLAWLR